MTPIDPLALAVAVASILEGLRIPYVIGGSVASSVIGEPRSSLDVDIMIDASVEDVRRLAAALRGEFYVDENDAVEAVKSSTAFNAIHLGSSTKVDFFIAEPLGRRQIARRRAVEVRPGLPRIFFYSPEDLVIRRLLWYRAGGEPSSSNGVTSFRCSKRQGRLSTANICCDRRPTRGRSTSWNARSAKRGPDLTVPARHSHGGRHSSPSPVRGA